MINFFSEFFIKVIFEIFKDYWIFLTIFDFFKEIFGVCFGVLDFFFNLNFFGFFKFLIFFGWGDFLVFIDSFQGY